jgi:exodeoxyribonuclease V beta subunit
LLGTEGGAVTDAMMRPDTMTRAISAPTLATAILPFDPLGALPEGTVLLEASAGTGKTYGIASLVLRLVAERRLGIHEILVVTFTEAATAELRERVRDRLRDAHALAVRVHAAGSLDALASPRDEVAAHVVRSAFDEGTLARTIDDLGTALERFDDAAIQTIHGFCGQVLRERAFECGAELDGDLLADVRELHEEIARDFWARETAALPASLVGALATSAGLDLGEIRCLVRAALRDVDAACIPDRDAPDASDRAAAITAIADREALARDIGARWSGEEGHAMLELLDAACEAKDLSGRSWRRDWIESRALAIAAWAAGEPAHEPAPRELAYFAASRLAASAAKGRRAPAHPLLDDIERFLAIEDRLADAIACEARRIERACIAWARTECTRRKRQRRQHDYDDLLRLVRDALRRDGSTLDGALGSALRESFRAVLIDEFQDTDAVQWEIFRRAFARDDHTLVLIGDPKQAIYRFRGADIDTYLAARHSAARRFALDANWRSDPSLLAALDALAGAHAAPFAAPEIEWIPVRAAKEDRLVVGDDAPPLLVRFIARAPELTSEKKNRITKERLDPALPAMVAADVVRFLGSDARIRGDDGVERDVGPADVAVLVRTNAQAREIQRALRAAGVPAVIHGGTSVFGSLEAAELATILAAVLEPSDQRLARAALATDLLGIPAARELSGEEMLGPGDVLARLEGDDAEWDRWSARFRAWRQAWRGERLGARTRGNPSVMRLVRRMLDEMELPARLLALDDGERRVANFLHAAELLHADAVREGRDPGATLAWLREQIAMGDEPGDDETRQLRLESDAESAQVVTVHASKGLEYGAVWCPYLWASDLARGDEKRRPFVPAEDGGARALHLTASEGDECLERLDDECFAESLRLAYVALTRARHRVTLWWGAVNGFEASPLAWLLHGGDASCVRDARTTIPDEAKSLDDDALRARLDEIAARAPGLIAIEEETGETAGRWRAPERERPALEARSFRRAASLDASWRVGSFTALTRGAHADEPLATDDDELPEAAGDAIVAGVDADGAIDDGEPVAHADFPASASAGICLHDILEAHDFTAPDALRPIVDATLDAFRFDAARWGGAVRETLASVIATPLRANDGATLRLAELPRARRLVELRFDIPVTGGTAAPVSSGIDAESLARAFESHPGGALDGEVMTDYASRLRKLGFPTLRGFLGGAMDLVAEQDGRWWLIDWKSNRLGAQARDYGSDRMLRAMLDAHYPLQYHLYALALHRWLGLRVRDYAWERDVGGVFYVFLRGVGDETGIFFDRPPLARIEALDRLFEEGGA